MNDQKNHQKIISILQLISQYLIVIIGVVGFCLILAELNEFKLQNKTLEKQNDVLENTLRQSYRPLGVARSTWDDKSMIIVHYPDMKLKSKDKFTFYHEYKLKNLGKGLLIFVGYLTYLDINGVDANKFRELILEGDLTKGIKIDTTYNQLQRTPIMPNDVLNVISEHKEIAFLKKGELNKYYSYTMFLYEDQDGNLYDTIHLEVLSFIDPMSTPEGLRAKLNPSPGSSYINETYKYYSPVEKQKLCSVMGRVDNKFKETLCN